MGQTRRDWKREVFTIKTDFRRQHNLFKETAQFIFRVATRTVPNMNAFYADYIRSRAENELSVEHHYKYDIFTVAIDQQLHELNSRFSEQATKLLVLCTSLDPRDSFRSFKIDDICLLASKIYPADFSEQERNNLRHQLQHYEFDVLANPQFQNLSTIADLCRRLAETRKSNDYYLIDRLYNIPHFLSIIPNHFCRWQILSIFFFDRLIRLVLTLPVSTATSERAFSAMKLVKTRLRNKMGDEFLRDCLIIYIEKEIAIEFTTDTLIDNFYDMKTRRVRLK